MSPYGDATSRSSWATWLHRLVEASERRCSFGRGGRHDPFQRPKVRPHGFSPTSACGWTMCPRRRGGRRGVRRGEILGRQPAGADDHSHGDGHGHSPCSGPASPRNDHGPRPRLPEADTDGADNADAQDDSSPGGRPQDRTAGGACSAQAGAAARRPERPNRCADRGHVPKAQHSA
jgi:hypothetical protein